MCVYLVEPRLRCPHQLSLADSHARLVGWHKFILLSGSGIWDERNPYLQARKFQNSDVIRLLTPSFLRNVKQMSMPFKRFFSPNSSHFRRLIASGFRASVFKQQFHSSLIHIHIIALFFSVGGDDELLLFLTPSTTAWPSIFHLAPFMFTLSLWLVFRACRPNISITQTPCKFVILILRLRIILIQHWCSKQHKKNYEPANYLESAFAWDLARFVVGLKFIVMS